MGAIKIDHLPPRLRQAFEAGSSGWKNVIHWAKQFGLVDLNFLTDLIFHLSHPELGGRDIRPGETELANEWKAIREKVRPLVSSPVEAPPGSKASAEDKRLRELLMAVDVQAMSRPARDRLQMMRLQILLIKALHGKPFDDGYWAFDFNDGFGRNWPCSYTDHGFGVQSVVRNSKKHAFRQFKTRAATATTPSEVAAVLQKLHDEMWCHLNVVFAWLHQNSAIGDSGVEKYIEVKLLFELEREARRNHPKSVYHCFSVTITRFAALCRG